MRRLTLLTTALVLTAGTAFGGGLGTMSDAERDAFQAEVRQYLLNNPEVMMEAMQVLQDRQDKAAADQDQLILSSNKDLIQNDPDSWVGGNPDGDITVVEFMDYRCGYCRKAYSEVANLVKSDGNIRFVVKELPILGDDSIASARFAIAMRLLHGDDAYETTHDALIALRGSPDTDTLSRLAVQLGYEALPVLDMMDDDKVTAIIAANHDLAGKLNITGTPTFVVEKALLRGYLPEDDMRQIVADQRGS
ncbi:MAG: DsbA family protein [Candidatus Saccharibacteria bacterium]|nr:DsbA family protein [Pseudorhodobacter sp.]